MQVTVPAATQVLERVPASTLDWLLAEDNPAVATLTRRILLGESDTPQTQTLWARRNTYPPVARILELQREDGSWLPPERDYKKYEGSLWQIIFLGEMWADSSDDRVRRAAAYAFSRQLPDGSFSCNGKPDASIACLTANVGRALARMIGETDEGVIAALAYCANVYRDLGKIDCHAERPYSLNSYCHMLTPKLLLFLGEVSRELWPSGAEELADACVRELRDKHVHRCLPAEAREFQDALWALPTGERKGFRERFLAEHEPLHYKEKAGWLKFGFPLSYNSDALEALQALAAIGEERRPEYEEAIGVVEGAADDKMRWKLQNTFNGKMLADVEAKGQPSKWLTLRALVVLAHYGIGE